MNLTKAHAHEVQAHYWLNLAHIASQNGDMKKADQLYRKSLRWFDKMNGCLDDEYFRNAMGNYD